MDAQGALTEAIDHLICIDLDTLDDTALHEAVTALAHQRDRLAIAHARLVARWDVRQIWRNDRSRSAAARLARETGSFTTTARRELRRARRLVQMPVTCDAGLSGRLSVDQVDVLTAANLPHRQQHMVQDETMLVDECRRLTARQSARLVAYWGRRVDAETGADSGHRDHASRVHVSQTLDGAVVINGDLDPLGGAAFANELRHLAERQGLADIAAGVRRTPAQRRAAALVEMARRSASAAPDARAPRPLFTVQLGDDSFLRLCELANGVVLSPDALAPWLTTADLETVLFDGPSTVVSVSHRRTFTGALRRAIEVRDRHCQHPSQCDVPADQCDVDHIVPHARGGTTDQFNGRLQCPTDNRRSELHDHDATPLPTRTVAPIDALRARIRWRLRHGT